MYQIMATLFLAKMKHTERGSGHAHSSSTLDNEMEVSYNESETSGFFVQTVSFDKLRLVI